MYFPCNAYAVASCRRPQMRNPVRLPKPQQQLPKLAIVTVAESMSVSKSTSCQIQGQLRNPVQLPKPGAVAKSRASC